MSDVTTQHQEWTGRPRLLRVAIGTFAAGVVVSAAGVMGCGDTSPEPVPTVNNLVADPEAIARHELEAAGEVLRTTNWTNGWRCGHETAWVDGLYQARHAAPNEFRSSTMSTNWLVYGAVFTFGLLGTLLAALWRRRRSGSSRSASRTLISRIFPVASVGDGSLSSLVVSARVVERHLHEALYLLPSINDVGGPAVVTGSSVAAADRDGAAPVAADAAGVAASDVMAASDITEASDVTVASDAAAAAPMAASEGGVDVGNQVESLRAAIATWRDDVVLWRSRLEDDEAPQRLIADVDHALRSQQSQAERLHGDLLARHASGAGLARPLNVRLDDIAPLPPIRREQIPAWVRPAGVVGTVAAAVMLPLAAGWFAAGAWPFALVVALGLPALVAIATAVFILRRRKRPLFFGAAERVAAMIHVVALLVFAAVCASQSASAEGGMNLGTPPPLGEPTAEDQVIGAPPPMALVPEALVPLVTPPAPKAADPAPAEPAAAPTAEKPLDSDVIDVPGPPLSPIERAGDE